MTRVSIPITEHVDDYDGDWQRALMGVVFATSPAAEVVGGAVQVDLDGKAHGGVETPHVQEWQDNVIPSGPRAGEVGSRSKVGEVRPATQEDLDLVEEHLDGEE